MTPDLTTILIVLLAVLVPVSWFYGYEPLVRLTSRALKKLPKPAPDRLDPHLSSRSLLATAKIDTAKFVNQLNRTLGRFVGDVQTNQAFNGDVVSNFKLQSLGKFPGPQAEFWIRYSPYGYITYSFWTHEKGHHDYPSDESLRLPDNDERARILADVARIAGSSQTKWVVPEFQFNG